MSRFESAAVPFIAIGNRLCLTAHQLAEAPELADFVARFPERFEHDPHAAVWLLIEREPASGILARRATTGTGVVSDE